MDGGQIVNIPLDSELDIKSSDMLVPVNKPKFQHNRQKFQGRYLPSSVRFEHDGYAAGNDVYEFDIAEGIQDLGSIVVVRRLMNNNPTYKLIFRDLNDHNVASLYYNPRNRIKDTETETCDVTGDDNPHITGTLNGKSFDIAYNSSTGELTADQGTSDRHIAIVGNTLKQDYVMEVRLCDEDAVVNISFEGMTLPTEHLMNGIYEFGRFEVYENDVSTWKCGSFTFNIDSENNIFVKDAEGSLVVLDNDSVVVNSDGTYNISFDTVINFVDTLQVTWQKFFPFFTGLTAAPVSKDNLIAWDADPDNEFNHWKFNMTNPVHLGMYNQGMLFRNKASATGLPQNAEVFNKFHIAHTIYMWSGIHASNGVTLLDESRNNPRNAYRRHYYTYDVNHNRLNDDGSISSDVFIPKLFLDYSGQSNVWYAHNELTRKTLDSDVYITFGEAYNWNYINTQSEAQSLPAGVRNSGYDIYELVNGIYQVKDSLADGLHYTRLTTILPEVYVWDGYSKHRVELAGNPEIHAVMTYKVGTGGAVSGYDSDVWCNSLSSTQTWDINLEDHRAYGCSWVIFDRYNYDAQGNAIHGVVPNRISPRRRNGNASQTLDSLFTYNNKTTSDDVSNGRYVRGKIYEASSYMYIDVPVRIGDTGNYANARYTTVWDSNIGSNGGYRFDVELTGYDGLSIPGRIASHYEHDSSKAVYGAQCAAMVKSEFFIAKDDILTDELDKTYFGINAIAADSGYLDVSDIFEHKIVQAKCDEQLEVIVYLCAKGQAQRIYYTPEGTSAAGTSSIPEYIVNNDLDASIHSLNTRYILIKPDYNIATGRDTDYTMAVTISGRPAKDSQGRFFRYIKKIDSDLEQNDVLYGNEFTDTIIPEIISMIKYAIGDVDGYVEIGNEDTTVDTTYMHGYTQTVDMTIENTIKRLVYNNKDFAFTSNATGTFEYKGYTIAYTSGSIDNSNADAYSRVDVPVILTMSYSSPAHFALNNVNVPVLVDNSFSLVSLSKNVAVVIRQIAGTSYEKLTIDFDMREVMYQRGVIDNGTETWYNPRECSEAWHGNSNAVDISTDGIVRIHVVLAGIFNTLGITGATYTQRRITGNVSGTPVEVDLTAFDESGIGCMYTRINEPALERVQFAQLDTDAEFQFLKQQWDTTSDVENIWWIDSTHTLKLTKSKLVLEVKTDELDDWNGDVFQIADTWNVAEVITSSVKKYFCSSAYGGETARFITVTDRFDGIDIKVYDPLLTVNMLTGNNIGHVTLDVVKRDIGTSLCPDNVRLYTYSDVDVSNMISQAKWSATCIDGKLIVGIHYDNNFNQWAVVFNITDNVPVFSHIIQGYGFVGVNGCLTGGEIPTKFFDVDKGFSAAVMPVDSLTTDIRSTFDEPDAHNIKSLKELWTVTDKVVGTEAQQWYISKEITSIVSHIVYSSENHRFVVEELPLNNNYDVDYESASYAESYLSNYGLEIKSLTKFFDVGSNNTAWNALCVLMGLPFVYTFGPRISIANYLQQTLGQAAYVHYNSTSVVQQKELSKENTVDNFSQEEADREAYYRRANSVVGSDEISFDIQSVKQEQSCEDPYTFAFGMLAAATISAVDLYKTRKEREWGTTDNKWKEAFANAAVYGGREVGKFGEYFTRNMQSMGLMDMMVQSVAPTQTSEVTAVKTLDMFYSTSDKQEIKAGPGYVQHNFVAQCIAQSVTAVQSEYRQQRLSYTIGALSLVFIQQLNKGLETIRSTLSESVTATGGPTFMGVVNSIPIAAGTVIAYNAADLACNVSRIGIELLTDMLKALGADKIQSEITALSTNNNYDIEAKHRYGSKSECFMYPCFGIDTPQVITDESVDVITQNKSWKLDMDTKLPEEIKELKQPNFVTRKVPEDVQSFKGNVPYYIAMVKGVQRKVCLPDRMAYVIGTESFLPTTDFKNTNIGDSEPVFLTPPFQDYIVDLNWEIAQTASEGMTTWISCRDTKIIDGEMSNAVISDDFCGIAAPYTAIEVKKGIDRKYIRPVAITPNAIALNNTGLNCAFEEKMYHAFDGYGYRVINWCGAPGMGKNHQTLMYSFLVNDRFKRSNKLPPNEFIGNFSGDPTVAIHGDSNDKIFVLATQPGENSGLVTGVVGEDKDIRRYALPVFSEYVNTMPAAVKTVAVQMLSVVDGVTSLTTENRDLQTAYKAPVSIDFTIGKNKYRYTSEYICSVEQERGVTMVNEIVPCLGLTYLGSTPYEAYLYSQAERQYYVFTGGSALRKVDTIERFRNVVNGRYDFVNQEIVLPCIATFLRLDKQVKDDADETDNTMIARLTDNKFVGEVQPPLDTIYNTRSGFKTISVPSGIAFQGPNRCIINRFVLSDYMVDQIKGNYGKWKRVPREEYHPFRQYKAKYHQVDESIGADVEVQGWTHNPFLLVTAPLGVEENTDCMFEWEITFCYPVEMEKLYGPDNYAVVNIQAETMTPGGKVVSDRPVHVFLTKELFTRTGNYGYYSFRYQSKCGAGNRERLHIWSDQYICISSLVVEYKAITQRRTEMLTQQVDIQRLSEI